MKGEFVPLHDVCNRVREGGWSNTYVHRCSKSFDFFLSLRPNAILNSPRKMSLWDILALFLAVGVWFLDGKEIDTGPLSRR